MLYLSQLLNRKVKDSAEVTVGRLKDIVVRSRPGIYSPLEFLLVKNKRGEECFIPYDYVENLSERAVGLKNLIVKVPCAEPEGELIFLVRDCLDQQIMDTDGARVVRVNDLQIGLFKDKMCALGLDISFKGLLRRLGLDDLDWLDWFKVNLIDWRKAHPVKGILRLDTISKGLIKLHPADLANIVEDLNIKEGSKLVKALDLDAAAQVLEEVEPELQKNLVSHLGAEEAVKIVEKMSVDEITDLVKMLPKMEAEKILSLLKMGSSGKVTALARYGDDTAGGLMTTDFMTARPNWTVRETIDEIKKKSDTLRSLLYVYVTDSAGNFEGSVSLRALITSADAEALKDIMKQPSPLSTLKLDQKVNRIIEVMTKYNLYTAAVLDEKNKLAGIVTIDDVMRCLAPHA